MRVAVIDLGTNTFNLLICDVVNNNLVEIIREKRAVKLGQNGITNNIINESGINRGLEAIKDYRGIIDVNNVHKIVAVATSAIRTTTNGKAFVNKLNHDFNLNIEIIDGNKEAEFIYFGIKNALKLNNENVLMLDIGGGSNEFIIGNKNEILWKKSFMLGIARLIEKFNPSDPIKESEIHSITNYIKDSLSDLFLALNGHAITKLIGSSGTFDSICNILYYNDNKCFIENKQKNFKFENNKLYDLLNKIIYSTYSERINIKGIDLMRIEMLPLACLFIKVVLDNVKPLEVFQSSYSIKEGIIYYNLSNKLFN